MAKAIANWIKALENYPGWKEYRRKRVGHALYFSDPNSSKEVPGDFTFSREIEVQHDVIMTYLEALQSLNNLKQIEYYFRNYPFRNGEVSKSDHLTNICEMYFSRFFEMKERLKSHLNALLKAVPHGSIAVGPFIKQFERVFDQEIRARHSVHHKMRFGDVALERIFLTESIAISTDRHGWHREHNVAYRQTSREWAERVRQRGAVLDGFIEEVARVTLASCGFLHAD